MPPVPPAFAGIEQSRGNFTWSDGKQKLEVKYEGKVEFTDDDSDVKTLSPGGVLRIREGGWTSSRTVEFEADASGTVRRRYWEGMSEKPFVPDGKAWLAQALPRIIRQTAFGAEGRVARILKAKGPAGVFAEIALIDGSWAKRVYFTELLKSPGLDAATVRQALEQAGRQIESDYELASLLISSDRLLVDEATRRAYFEAAASIQSDYEMRRAYSSALKRGPVPSDVLAGVLAASIGIESDYEEAELLVQIARLQPLDASTRGPFLKALATIDSDYECRRVISAVVRADPSPETLATMLDPSIAIDSDFEQASFPDRHRQVPADRRATQGAVLQGGRFDQLIVRARPGPAGGHEAREPLAGDRRRRLALGPGHEQRPRGVAGADGRGHDTADLCRGARPVHRRSRTPRQLRGEPGSQRAGEEREEEIGSGLRAQGSGKTFDHVLEALP